MGGRARRVLVLDKEVGMSLEELEPTEPGDPPGSGGGEGQTARQLAASLAEGFIRRGHSPQEVLEDFRDPTHGRAFEIYGVLGERQITDVINRVAWIYGQTGSV